MTGELHLEKPSVEQEVLRGLHFFDETLFEMAPKILSGLAAALKESYPDRRFDVPPFFQFGSWIGGDRDGNPFVTTPVTRTTLKQNALASLRHYRARIGELARYLSITERAAAVPESFRAELARELEASGDAVAIRARNPGEAYRQYLTCVLRKLDATVARTEGNGVDEGRPYYANADELILDLRVLESALEEANLASIADRPRASGALRGAALPLLHRAPRPSREHHAHHRDLAGSVAGDGGAGRRRAARPALR